MLCQWAEPHLSVRREETRIRLKQCTGRREQSCQSWGFVLLSFNRGTIILLFCFSLNCPSLDISPYRLEEFPKSFKCYLTEVDPWTVFEDHGISLGKTKQNNLHFFFSCKFHLSHLADALTLSAQVKDTGLRAPMCPPILCHPPVCV